MKKVKKVLGYILYNLFAKNLPVSYAKINLFSKKIRGFCGKLLLESCGTNVNIERGATFSSKVQIGDNSGIGINAFLQGRVVIGKNVMMGPECIIYTINHAFSRVDISMREQGLQEEKPVAIGDDVWIGGRVIILPGVKIGSGVIIGAGSVVTKNIPDYAIVGGNPATIRKLRKDD